MYHMQNVRNWIRWIISKYNKLIKEVTEDMDQYDHMKAVRKIQDFVIEDLSNWYIRRARRRFWAEELDEDKKSGICNDL